MRRTRIVCTIGPACSDPKTLRRMAEAGMDVARLNFSHGTHDEHARAIERLRRIGSTVLQDLAGPKARIGKIRGDQVTLRAGRTIRLVPREISGDERALGVSIPRLVRSLAKGDDVLLADGRLQLRVESRGRQGAECRVVVGGELASNKGITVPSRSLDIPALTAKDRRDLEFGRRHGVDMVALSFVRTAADVRKCRRLASMPVVAKIEKAEALKNLAGILKEADGIMVARGDLGVEIPLERVPIEQKRILKAAGEACIPAVTATQMLRSMISNPSPTRAEAADVANAVLDGTDAVMLSEETAVGRYPVEAVRFIRRILQEADPFVAPRIGHARKGDSEAVAESAVEIAMEVGARAILIPTRSGSTARRVAACRPPCRVIAFCPSPDGARRLSMVWGVEARIVPRFGDHPIAQVVGLARGIVRGKVVVTAAWPFRERGHTNLAVVTSI